MNDETMPAPAAAALAAAKEKLSTLGGCALLIGVEQYPAYDGAADLLAGRNDVLAYWKVCRRLGYRPEHIHVLTSPKLTEQDIVWAEQELGPELHPKKSRGEIEELVKGWFAGEAPKVVLGEATREAILEGVKGLAAHLVFTVKLEWEGWKLEQELASLPGLLTYSGHGAQREGQLVLCPSDLGQALENAISFEELRALVDAGDDIRAEGTPHPADNLTVVLDCCFASRGPSRKGQRVTSLASGGASPGSVPVANKEISNRVFCASGRDEQGYQAMLGGYWYSAFTWALTVALEQWTMEQEGQFRRSTISHTELLFRARMLLKALSFSQHPVLIDKAGIGNTPVFHHGSDAGCGDETSSLPNAERRSVQVDPSVSVLLGSSGDGYLSSLHYAGGTAPYYVKWDSRTEKAKAHKLVLADGAKRNIVVGDTVYIMTTESLYYSTFKWVNAIPAGGNNLTYQDKQDTYAQWVVHVQKNASGSVSKLGEEIHPGDTLWFKSVSQSTDDKPMYLCRESDNYLTTRAATDRLANIDWVVTRAA